MRAARVLAAGALLLAGACGRRGEEPPGLSFEAVKRAADAVQRDARPVPPVDAGNLLPFLPPPPPGWTAGDAGGGTSREGEHPVSAVRRSYRGPGLLEVTITDTGGEPMVLMGVTLAAQVRRETAAGWDRGVLLDGCPGVERWRRDGGQAELTLVVGKRYIVTMKASRVPEGFLRTVWARVDGARLAKLS